MKRYIEMYLERNPEADVLDIAESKCPHIELPKVHDINCDVRPWMDCFQCWYRYAKEDEV